MWSLAGSQAFDHQICGFDPRWLTASLLSSVGQARLQLWDPVVLLQSFCCFGPKSRRVPGRSAALDLCVGQLASAPSAYPPTRGFRCGRDPGVSGVGSQLGFQLWAPSPLIWVCATGLQVSTGTAYPAFTVQGLRGEGCQRPWGEFSN